MTSRSALDFESEYLRNSINWQPWLPRDEGTLKEQGIFQEILRRHAGARALGQNCFISPDAHIYTQRLAVGENSWIAAGAIVRGDVAIGANSSINPLSHIAGTVRIGNGVRIAGSVSIYGLNHGYRRTDIWIYQQEHTSKGVTIGDGTWIGAASVIIDGVTIGSHCIIAAGSVVTKDVQDYTIVGGNPAKILKTREVPNLVESLVEVGTVRRLLYKVDPYIDLAFKYPPDLQEWDSEHPVFAEAIAAVRPRLIVEVGTWKGASAIHMAGLCRKLELQTEIVCIDTWLGNWQHWSRSEGGVGSRDDLKIVNGFPRLFYQFMSNVIATGCENEITPLPLTGVAGAKLFEHFKIFPDIIYIDGDHEYESVLFDLRLWLKRLGPSGILIGDDYNWPGVKKAVEEVLVTEPLILNVTGQKFTLTRV